VLVAEDDGEYVVRGIAKMETAKIVHMDSLVPFRREGERETKIGPESQIKTRQEEDHASLYAIARGEELENTEREIALAARLVAIGACHRGVHKGFRRAYAMMARTGSDIFLHPGGEYEKDHYVRDLVNGSFVRMSDGYVVSRPSPEWTLLKRTLEAAAHRNANAKEETVLAVVPLSFAATRESLPCRMCEKNGGCPASAVTVLPGGNALLTPGDLHFSRMLAAAKRYDVMVRRVQMSAGGAAAGLSTRTEIMKRATRAREKECESCPSAGALISEEIERDAEAYVAGVAASERFVRETYGVDVLATVNDRDFRADIATVALQFDDLKLSLPAGDELVSRDTDDRHSKSALVPRAPGYALLAASGFELSALIPLSPPCIAQILEATSADRHPFYRERVLVGTLMCNIAGLLADRDGFYAAWKSMFQHPEPSCELSKDPSRFERSRYGRKAADDTRDYYEKKGKTNGCGHAKKYGLCPFAGAGDASGIECLKDLVTMLKISPDGMPKKITSPTHYYKICAWKSGV
jgi:hypothetical protein